MTSPQEGGPLLQLRWPPVRAYRARVKCAKCKNRNTNCNQKVILSALHTENALVTCEPPVGIEPTTYSLRVNRSAD
jgi:hypothetical protein